MRGGNDRQAHEGLGLKLWLYRLDTKNGGLTHHFFVSSLLALLEKLGKLELQGLAAEVLRHDDAVLVD